MLAKAVLSLGLWLRFAAGQDTPEPGECLQRQRRSCGTLPHFMPPAPQSSSQTLFRIKAEATVLL